MLPRVCEPPESVTDPCWHLQHRGGFISGGQHATQAELLPRLALVWSGATLVAAALFRNSHEQVHVPDAATRTRPTRAVPLLPVTEILLFGVRNSVTWRRKRLGTALLAYITHLCAATAHRHE